MNTHNTNRTKKLCRAICIYALVPYLTVTIVFVVIQRRLIYRPTTAADLSVPKVELNSPQFTDTSIKTADGETIRGWLLKSDRNQNTALVLYFGGNAGNRFERIHDLKEVARCGYDVLVFDYRGFGDSTGNPSETALIADAKLCWKHAVDELGYSEDRIVVFGESLGGAVALSLWDTDSGSSPAPAAVVLNSTFATLPDAVGWLYPAFPFWYLIFDRWPSIDRIQRVTAPITIFHGSADSMVPIEHARRLAAAAGDMATFVEIPDGEHNGLPPRQLRETLRSIALGMQPKSLKTEP